MLIAERVHMPVFMKLLVVSLFLSALLLAGCASEPPEAPQVTISLGQIVSEPVQVDREVYMQNNCGGSETTDYEVSRSRIIAHELQLATGFEVNAKGEVSVLGTGVALGAAVSGQIGTTYGTSESMERAVTVRAAPGTRMEHEISYQEVWKTGAATVIVNGKSTSIPFKYRADFTLVLLDSRKVACDGATVVPVYTPSPTNTVAPTAALPTATNTNVPPTPTSTVTQDPEPNVYEVPNTPEEAAQKWGGSPAWWRKIEVNGWKLEAQLTVLVGADWRIDFVAPDGRISSCADTQAPGVYGPATVDVMVATLWYVPGETKCPPFTNWAKANP
jgi:hypothetical protein